MDKITVQPIAIQTNNTLSCIWGKTHILENLESGLTLTLVNNETSEINRHESLRIYKKKLHSCGWRPFEIVLVSKTYKPIKEGYKCLINWGVDIKGQKLYDIDICSKIGVGGIHYFNKLGMCFGEHEVPEKIYEVIATQKQLSHDLIFNLVNESGSKHLNSFDIEILWKFERDDKGKLFKSKQIPKLTKGFVSII